MEEYYFSRDRILAGTLRLIDYVGITTLIRIFIDDSKLNEIKSPTDEEIFEHIRKHI